MANLTIREILGSDAVSASRVIINDNFNTIKDVLDKINILIDTDTNAIGNNSANVTALSSVITNGQTVYMSVNNGGLQCNVNSLFSGEFKLSGDFLDSSKIIVSDGETFPVDKVSNYIFSNPGSYSLVSPSNLKSGKIITLFNTSSAPIVITTDNRVSGATGNNISMTGSGSTVTLKYLNNGTTTEWYIVSMYNSTLVAA